jgi:hypothetical protein
MIQSQGSNEFFTGTICFSELIPRLSYGSGDEGGRKRDLRTNIPLLTVPSEKQCLEKSLQLLPVLKLTPDDLERNADGSFRTVFTVATETYLETGAKQTKEMVRMRRIFLFQRVPGGKNYSWSGATEPPIGGGALDVSFVSEGKIAAFVLTFRDFQPAGFEKALSSREIVDRFAKGEARTAQMFLPESLTITNCVIVYPQGSTLLRQQFLRPTYRLTGFDAMSDKQNTFSFFVPVR